MAIRQPIITVLGHVDHGKTTILDRIRNTKIAKKESGGITQHIGATEIPKDVIIEASKGLLERLRINLTIPGLLFIDTPGHEAFTSLRRRGGSIADLAILVIDINEGVMPQTRESIDILKAFRVPFVIAFNKIDRIRGWKSGEVFSENFARQTEEVRQRFEEMFYRIVGQLSEAGINSDRFDRISDFTRTFAIVPVSGLTGEGIGELLALVAGLAQQFLRDNLEVGSDGRAVIIETKELKGFGQTFDAIVYDGTIKKGQECAVLGSRIERKRLKFILKPASMTDIRVEKRFVEVESVGAAAGVKLVFDSPEGIIPGSRIVFGDIEKAMEEMEEEIKEAMVETQEEGLIIKADTIGGLEAMRKILGEHPIRFASVGNITKDDIIKASLNRKYRIVLGFNVQCPSDIEEMAKSHGVRVVTSKIIYRLPEHLEKYLEEEKRRKIEKEMAFVTRPGKFIVLPGCIFRATNPAIVGAEVTGLLKPGWHVFKSGNTGKVGRIKQIQINGKPVPEARTGDRVAISIDGPFNFGRNAKVGDVFYTHISKQEYGNLKKNYEILSPDEKSVLEEIKNEMKSDDPLWDLGA